MKASERFSERYRHVANQEASHVSVHRLELLAGSVRRRKFTRALKEAIVSETLAGELMVTDLARRHALDRSAVDRWRRELGVLERVEDASGFLAAITCKSLDCCGPAAQAECVLWL